MMINIHVKTYFSIIEIALIIRQIFKEKKKNNLLTDNL